MPGAHASRWPRVMLLLLAEGACSSPAAPSYTLPRCLAANAACINTAGSFRCQCWLGFVGTGRTCTAVPGAAAAIEAKFFTRQKGEGESTAWPGAPCSLQCMCLWAPCSSGSVGRRQKRDRSAPLLRAPSPFRTCSQLLAGHPGRALPRTRTRLRLRPHRCVRLRWGWHIAMRGQGWRGPAAAAMTALETIIPHHSCAQASSPPARAA